MKKKLILTSSIMILIFGLSGCKQQEQMKIKEEPELDYTISDGYVELKSDELKIIEWSYSAKEPDNPDKNSASFMGDVTMGSNNNMSKKAININLKEGQSLKIETNTEYPITVMLKDNSNEEYIFNKTSKPVDSTILVDSVKKDGQYELMLDFNEINEFTFKVYIVNQK